MQHKVVHLYMYLCAEFQPPNVAHSKNQAGGHIIFGRILVVMPPPPGWNEPQKPDVRFFCPVLYIRTHLIEFQFLAQHLFVFEAFDLIDFLRQQTD